MKLYATKDSYGKPGPFILAITPMAANRLVTKEAPGFLVAGVADACLIGSPFLADDAPVTVGVDAGKETVTATLPKPLTPPSNEVQEENREAP